LNNHITYSGVIEFEPRNRTKKHEKQASWKRVAMVVFDGEMCEYYAWFINRRYNLKLNKPLRGAHITFVNDAERDMNDQWGQVKAKWHGKPIDVTISLDVRSDVKHWWMVVPEEHRTQLHDIRTELGLSRPYFGLHMTIGLANDRNIQHSEYIIRGIQNGLIT
jgi:hypothetical protein